jgi:hypothetical protein
MDSGTGHQPESEEPRKVYTDGREVDVTGDPADGIWIQGLPGEVPDKIGDIFATPEKAERSRRSQFFHEVVEGTNDLFDSVKENTSLSYDSLQHPPSGHAEVAVPTNRHGLEVQHHGPEAGGLATGVLAAGIMLWAGARWSNDWIDRRLRGAHHARDG